MKKASSDWKKRNLYQLFVQHVENEPDRAALLLGEERLTYRELADRASTIASRLDREGVGQGDVIGVFLDRSFDLIASLLGVLSAGAAYVPLDTNYPSDRIAFMATDTGMKHFLSETSLAGRLPTNTASVINLDEIGSEPLNFDLRDTGFDDDAASGRQLAYVMYTSGSTGIPKGVAVPHRGIVRLVQEPDYVQISAEDVFLQASPVSFDASTFEIWGALTNGARLVLMPPGQPSLQEIGEVIRREQVSVLWLTAGLFNLMVDERVMDLAPVRQLLAGGDVLSQSHVRRALAALPNTRIINGYGPTENTTFTCCHTIPRNLPDGGSIPIGRAIRGTTVRVVDERLCEVADGEEGELVTGGLGVALGYWNRPDLTSERFVPDPFSSDPTARLYRTGDRVRRLSDGTIEFLGRKDNQVKLRGYRIELGEIENVLRQHGGVRDCAVTVWSDKSGNKTLAAWVVSSREPSPSAPELRAHIQARLPDYMVPAFWSFLEKLPLNGNGKVDRASLPEPADVEQQAPPEPPRGELEKLLVQLWQELLNGRPVGVTQNYFDLGASSLLVARVHERLCRLHGFSLKLTDLFRFTTVRTLAGHLEKLHAPSTGATGVMSQRGRLSATALNRFKRN